MNGLRLFRLGNQGTRAWWVFADTSEEAIDISMEQPSPNARKRENIRFIADQTDHFYTKNLNTDIQKVAVKGIASLHCGKTWVVVRAGKKLKGV